MILDLPLSFVDRVQYDLKSSLADPLDVFAKSEEMTTRNKKCRKGERKEGNKSIERGRRK